MNLNNFVSRPRISTMQRLIFLVYISLLCLTSGCLSLSSIVYSGSGRLIDHGPMTAHHRYVLDLGPIDLRTRGVVDFEIGALPDVEFTLGINVTVSDEQRSVLEQKPINALVSMELRAPDGHAVIDTSSRLNLWTWLIPGDLTYAFIYKETEPSTYFTPIASGRYRLRVRVAEPDRSDVTYKAVVLAQGGGWK
jgi:hypothetical protein